MEKPLQQGLFDFPLSFYLLFLSPPKRAVETRTNSSSLSRVKEGKNTFSSSQLAMKPYFWKLLIPEVLAPLLGGRDTIERG
jgi:hypothetical protein